MWSTDHARIETLFKGFSSGPGWKIFVQDVSPGSLDGILLSIFLGHKPVLEPLFCPISSNPLDSCLALIGELQSAKNPNPMDSKILGRTMVQVQVRDPGIC